jgi:hypothetical protein
LSGVQIGPRRDRVDPDALVDSVCDSERVKAVIAPLVPIVEQLLEPLYMVTDVQLTIAAPFLRCGARAWTMKK